MISPAKQEETEQLITAFFQKYKEQPLSSLGRTGAEAINHLISIIEDYKEELLELQKNGGAANADNHNRSY